MTPAGRRDWMARRFREDLLAYRAAPYAAGVQFIQGAHPCPHAAELAGAYRLDAAPVFPPAACTCTLGACCCRWELIFNDDPAPAAWKTAVHVHPDAGPRIERAPELLPKESVPGLIASFVRAVKQLFI